MGLVLLGAMGLYLLIAIGVVMWAATVELAIADLDTRARNEFSALVSLITLISIVLTASSALLEGALGTAWGTEFSQWQADAILTSEQRAAGQANFGDRYLADRTTMLAWLLKGNRQDALSNSTTMFVKTTQPGVSDIWQFTDKASERKIEVSPTLAQGWHDVYFGNDEDNSFTGSLREDDLYGSGNDIPDGGTGRVCKPPGLRTQPSNKDPRRVSVCANCICAPYALRIFSGKRLSANHEIYQRAAQWVS